jgi:CHAD domain-containing protein
MRAILLHLLDTLERNVDGVVDDHDTEFLHDLRVACRRSRSALTQLKGVLPADEVAPYIEGFKWLGTVTGPCRDLDVFLLELDDLRELAGSSEPNRLGPLEEIIVGDRARAWREVVRAVTSRRFATLTRRWRQLLLTPPKDPRAVAGRPVEALANERIRKAHRRVLKRGSKLVGNPVPDRLHRLRIDAKKLRYLLEFFRSLYTSGRVAPLVKRLKRLQDNLGGFHDCEVQRDRLRGFARKVAAVSPVPTETLLAMGRLEAALDLRQESHRQDFAGRFTRFASPSGTREYDDLLESS